MVGRPPNFGGFDEASDVTIQSDGKIVVAGTRDVSGDFDFALVRFRPRGGLDKTFDGDGKVTSDIGFQDAAAGLAIDGDGRIVVVGYSDNTFAVARYGTTGSPDVGFDGDGLVTTAIGTESYASDVAIDGDERIVVVGYAYIRGESDFALARYGSTGLPDASFGGAGTIATDLAVQDSANGAAIQADGKIVAVGQAASMGGEQNFAVTRYLG